MELILQWLIQNVLTIMIVLLLLCAIILVVMKFLKLTPKEQLAKVQACLLAWVTEAERLLQSKTGQVKKSLVWTWVKNKFPIIAMFISEETYDKILDDALDKLREMLLTNDALYKYVYGKDRVTDVVTSEDTNKDDRTVTQEVNGEEQVTIILDSDNVTDTEAFNTTNL